MEKIESNLFKKFEEAKILKETASLIRGGVVAPGGTTNDCTGTGGDCWDADSGTNVVDDMTWTGGKDSGNDTCQ